MEPTFETERYRWLKVRVPIDFLSLDEEVSQMSTLIQMAGEITAQVIEDRDSAKELLAQVKSEVASRLRSIPDANGKYRSESTITSEIESQPEYKEQQELLSKIRLDAALWISLTESLRTKAASLRTSAELIQSGFITRDYILDKRRTELRTERKR